MPKPLFSLGQVVATPGALSLSVDFMTYLTRHVIGDWGDLCLEDRSANDTAVDGDMRILSSYDTPAGTLWIITEWDRSVTTLLRPDEY